MNNGVPNDQSLWTQACRRGLISGSGASLLSLAALALLSRRETGSAVSATNATSHWLWGDRALRQHRAALRYTALGYLIHHASSVFWAVIYERWSGGHRGGARAVRPWRDAALVSALACATDYLATPKRLTPGFEHHLSKPSMAAVYLAFGVGLAAGGLLSRRVGAAAAPRQAGPQPRSTPQRPTLH